MKEVLGKVKALMKVSRKEDKKDPHSPFVNELISLISLRKSKRMFHQFPISFHHIYECIETALHYPCPGNIQNTSFIYVSQKQTISKLAEYASDQAWIKDVPCVLVVLREDTKIKDFYLENAEKYSIQATASCIQNLLLLIEAHKLGACFVGAFEEQSIKELLEIKDSLTIDALIPIGYAKDSKEERVKEDVLSKIYFEQFGNKKRI